MTWELIITYNNLLKALFLVGPGSWVLDLSFERTQNKSALITMWSVNSLYTSASNTVEGCHFTLWYSPLQCKVSILNPTHSLSSDLLFEYPLFHLCLSQNGAVRTKWASGFSPTRGELSRQCFNHPTTTANTTRSRSRKKFWFLSPPQKDEKFNVQRWGDPGHKGTLLEFGRPGILSSWGHLGTYFTVLMEQFLAFFPFDFYLLAIYFSSSFIDITDI